MNRLSAARPGRGVQLLARLLRGMLFLAIVWPIAGAFLALEVGIPWLQESALKVGLIPDELAMPGTLRGAGAAPCADARVESGGARTSAPIDPSTLHQARYLTWQLGRDLGFAAAVAGTASDEQIQSLQRGLATLAEAIAVPAPLPPKIQHLANALHEFEVYLEQDPQCVAARLTSKYEPSFGYLYKFGAVIGHSIPFRVNNIGAVFEPQIRRYGQLAGIPEALWLPMTQDWPDNLTMADAQQKTYGILARLDQHFKEASP
jgi:hypothetical protein